MVWQRDSWQRIAAGLSSSNLGTLTGCLDFLHGLCGVVGRAYDLESAAIPIVNSLFDLEIQIVQLRYHFFLAGVNLFDERSWSNICRFPHLRPT